MDATVLLLGCHSWEKKSFDSGKPKSQVKKIFEKLKNIKLHFNYIQTGDSL